jgi:hypothetical protein
MEKIPDYRIKHLQKLFRPYFSPQSDSYEIDYVYGGNVNVYDIETGQDILEHKNYLFCININSIYFSFCFIVYEYFMQVQAFGEYVSSIGKEETAGQPLFFKKVDESNLKLRKDNPLSSTSPQNTSKV